jgi:hypothetical protein
MKQKWKPAVFAIARPEAGVDGQLHQIREPSDLLRPCGLAAGQRAELVQVHGLLAVRLQVGVDEGGVGDLVVGVVVDVLIHVLVQHRHGLGVGWAAAAAGDLTVLDAGELVVLLPEIGLDELRCGQELENRGVALGQPTSRTTFRTTFCERLRRLEQQASRTEAGYANRSALQQEGTAAGLVLRLFAFFHHPLLSEVGSVPACRRTGCRSTVATGAGSAIPESA